MVNGKNAWSLRMEMRCANFLCACILCCARIHIDRNRKRQPYKPSSECGIHPRNAHPSNLNNRSYCKEYCSVSSCISMLMGTSNWKIKQCLGFWGKEQPKLVVEWYFYRAISHFIQNELQNEGMLEKIPFLISLLINLKNQRKGIRMVRSVIELSTFDTITCGYANVVKID